MKDIRLLLAFYLILLLLLLLVLQEVGEGTTKTRRTFSGGLWAGWNRVDCEWLLNKYSAWWCTMMLILIIIILTMYIDPCRTSPSLIITNPVLPRFTADNGIFALFRAESQNN